MTRSGGGLSSRLLALALRVLPTDRRQWGDAMRADFTALERAADRRRFALGCLRVALTQRAWRVAAYLAAEATALVIATRSGIGGAFLAEVAALIVLAPPLVYWLARPSGVMRLSAERSARLTRRVGCALIAACAVVGVVYLAAEVAPRPAGSGAAAFWTGVIVFVLSGYTVLTLSVTSASAGVSSRALVSGSGLGAAAGLAAFALAPFIQSYSVHDRWLAAAYAAAFALVAVGAPAAAAILATRRGDGLEQGVTAGTIAGAVAALVLFGVGLTWLRFRPDLLDARVFAKGVDWLPSEANADAEGYLAGLVLLPMLSLPIATLGAVAARGRGRSWPALGALAALALAGLLCVPLEHALFDGRDSTSFGGIGTTSVSFSADGRALLTSNADQVSLVWNLANPGPAVRSATFSGSAVFSADGRTLATPGRLWRLAAAAHPERVATFADDGDPDAFSPDGRLLAVDGFDGNDGTVWDVSTRAHPKRLGTFAGQWAAFSPDGATFATSAPCWWDSRASATGCGTTLWSVAGGSRPHRIASLGGGDAVFSADGHVVATRAIESTVVLWDVADPSHPRHIATLTSGSDDDPPSTVIFSPDGRLLAAGGNDGSVRLWSATAPARATTLPPARRFPNGNQIGGSSTLTTVAFTHDGRMLLTIMGNDLVAEWNVSDPRHPIRTAVLTRSTQGAGVVAFSPDATTIAGAAVDGGNDVSLWRVR